MKSKTSKPNSESALCIVDFLCEKQIIDKSLYKEPFFIRRTYAGRDQKSKGAWTFWLEDDNGREMCGSQWTAKVCCKNIRKKTCAIFSERNAGLELIPNDIKPIDK